MTTRERGDGASPFAAACAPRKRAIFSTHYSSGRLDAVGRVGTPVRTPAVSRADKIPGAILDTASVQNVKRLLELFPLARLRQVWPAIKASKEELCHEVAETVERRKIIAFVNRHISCCKQHVYVFTIDIGGEFVFPSLIGETAQQVATADRSLYMTRSINRVVLGNPVEEITLEFLWPIRVELVQGYVLVRFVVVEKNIGSYVERPYYISDRGADENDIVKALAQSLNLIPADLHKGVKRLWADGVVDSHRTKYKKSKSLESEAMDEALGIREHNPDLCEVLSESPLYNTLFTIRNDPEVTVEVFSVDPRRGTLAFPRYTETVGDTDRVIRKILANNQ
jgi:hypothetical protein